jgi:hypothetical protein
MRREAGRGSRIGARSREKGAGTNDVERDWTARTFYLKGSGAAGLSGSRAKLRRGFDHLLFGLAAISGFF